MLPLHCCNFIYFNISWCLTVTVAVQSSDWHNLRIRFLILFKTFVVPEWSKNNGHFGDIFTQHFSNLPMAPLHSFVPTLVSSVGSPNNFFQVQLSKSQIAKPMCNLRCLNSAGFRAEQLSHWLKLLPVPNSWSIASPCCHVSRTLV